LEVVGGAFLGRRADDEEEHVLVAVVSELQRRAGLHGTDGAAGQLVPLRRIAEVDRRVSLEHDEDLFLKALGVALAPGPGRIAPELCTCVRKAIRDRRERPANAVAAVDELELSGMEDRVSDS
jgi:hypothetical protein